MIFSDGNTSFSPADGHLFKIDNQGIRPTVIEVKLVFLLLALNRYLSAKRGPSGKIFSN